MCVYVIYGISTDSRYHMYFTFLNSAVQNINLFTYLIDHLEKLLEAGR